MKIEHCKCFNFNCDDVITKVNGEYEIDQHQRFRFVKEDGVITDRINLNGKEYLGGLTPNCISNCEIKSRIQYKDSTGKHDNRKKK